jgi:hypothetical protein
MTTAIETITVASNKLQAILSQVDELSLLEFLDEESKKIVSFAKTYLLHLSTRIHTISQIEFLKESLSNHMYCVDQNIQQLSIPSSPLKTTDPRKRIIEHEDQVSDTQKVERRGFSKSVYDIEPKYLLPRDLMSIDVRKIRSHHIFIHRKFNLNPNVLKEIPDEYKDSVYSKNGVKLFFIKTADRGIRPYKFHAYYVGQNGFLYMYLKEIDCLVPAIYDNNFHKWK